ncbi:MAG: hypothetical protein HYS26_03295 [Candidatus Kaiserbacteria bacterium]|nr:MAG: hypothetical protein HYS26_03295 [Candidatus Kaiserbacteria bacterium]
MFVRSGDYLLGEAPQPPAKKTSRAAIVILLFCLAVGSVLWFASFSFALEGSIRSEAFLKIGTIIALIGTTVFFVDFWFAKTQ